MNNIKFRKTNLILRRFDSVLSKINDDKELEKYFTEYVLIIFYSEFEENLKSVLKGFLQEYSNEKIANFIGDTMHFIFKRIDKKDLEKTISYFGEDKKNHFISCVDKIQLEGEKSVIQKYKNFIENRHLVAHSKCNISVSWEEVKKIDKIGEKVIQTVKGSLYNNHA